MAADRRKRLLSAAVTVSYGSQDQYRGKKRDLRLARYDFSFSSHVSLKWDDNGKRVVAKEEQVGISRRHLRSFVPAAPCSNTKLADVLTVPGELFQLDDLIGVLSNEAWESLLSEKERGYLSQFLPQGLNPDQVLQALLGGDNFHFGNPCGKWAAKLCSGDFHPDAIVHHERSFKANKNGYYSELQHYHDNMIRNLLKVKKKFARSKDPEAEFLQLTLRSSGCAEKNVVPDVNQIRSLKPEDIAAAMSESLSSVPDEKLYYSDNQKLSVIREAEMRKRTRNDEVLKDKYERLVVPNSSLKVSPKLKKAEQLQKTNTISNDGAKYMSYVKISKKQHELVKSMKQCGSSIQSRSLNRVLGNLHSFNIKPYEMFVEEERNRIHKHWSNLANNYLPAALQNWTDKQSERRQIISSLLQELEEKLSLTTTHENLDNCDSHSEVQDEKLDRYGFHVQSQDNENLVNPENDKETKDSEDTDADSSRGPSVHQQDDDSTATQGSTSSDEKDTNPSSTQNSSPLHNPHFIVKNQCSVENIPLSVEDDVHLSPANVEFLPMDLNAENNVSAELDTRETCSGTMPPGLQVALQIHSSGITEGIPSCSSVNNVWESIGLPETYRHMPPSTQNASSSQLSFRHQQFVPSQQASLIRMQSDLNLEDTTKNLLNSHSTDHIPFFNPYPNGDRSEFLHSLIKRDRFHTEQKKTGLEFHPGSTVLLEPTQFHNHFRNQMAPSFTLDNMPKDQGGLFMNPNIQENIYSDTYPILAPQLSSRAPLSHSCFAADNRVHNGGWSASESAVFSSSSLGIASSSDQSLYSVLTQYNTLRASAPPFIPVGPTEQIISPTNYGQDMAREILMSSNSTAISQTVSSFNYLGNNTNIGWMNLGHQNPGVQEDPSARPFFNSWNQ